MDTEANQDDGGNGKFLVGDKWPHLTKNYESIQQIRKNDLVIKIKNKIIKKPTHICPDPDAFASK